MLIWIDSLLGWHLARAWERKQYDDGLGDSSVQNHFGQIQGILVLVSRRLRSGTPHKATSTESLQTPPRTQPNRLFRLFRRLPDIEIVVVDSGFDRQVSGG